MEFKEYGYEDFLDLFMGIMRASKNNTYKFALARFLLEYSSKNTGISVRYEEIAESFLRYYWDQECRSKLRQGPSNQTPEVIKIIRREFDKSYYPQSFDEIKKDEPARVQRCVGEVAKKCFDDVIPRFQLVWGKETKIFYHYMAREYHDKSNNKKIDPGGGIMLNPRAVGFFRNNYVMLYKTIILEWVRFLENLNFGMPHLTSKIEGIRLGRRDQTKFRRILEPFASKCFYCGTALGRTRTHVEHVIPFDYVGETEMWNLVLSCGDCNCSKLGSLPPKRYIGELITRNSQYRDRIKELDRSLNILRADFAGDIKWHYENAKRHGYAVLRNFPR